MSGLELTLKEGAIATIAHAVQACLSLTVRRLPRITSEAVCAEQVTIRTLNHLLKGEVPKAATTLNPLSFFEIFLLIEISSGNSILFL